MFFCVGFGGNRKGIRGVRCLMIDIEGGFWRCEDLVEVLNERG